MGCVSNDETKYAPYSGPPAFPNGRTPITLPAGDVAIVTNSGSDSVSIIDLDARTILTTFPVGRDPLGVDGPHHITVDPERRYAYVALAYPPPTVSPGPIGSQASVSRNGWVQKVSLLDGRIEGEVEVQVNPGEIVMSQDGSRLVVTHYDLVRALTPGATIDQQRATLALIDPKQILPGVSPKPTFISVCIAPHGAALVAPDARFAYVACYGEDVLAIVDLAAPEAPVVRVPVSGSPGIPGQPEVGPYAAVMSHDSKRIALANTESKDVRFFDVATQAMETTLLSVNGAAFFPTFTPDDARIYVPVQGPDQIVVGDARTGAVVNARPLSQECKRPHEAQLSTKGDALFVVCEGDHINPGSMIVLDPTTLATISTLPLGVYPDRLLVLRPR
jgi:YVTN family beta-propeller protein